MSDASEQSAEVPLARRAVLSYEQSLPTSPITVRKCRDICEAQIYANELAAHGIDYYVMNQNTSVLGMYVGLTYVDLQVRKEDAGQASAVLSKLEVNPLEVEPAESTDPDQPLAHSSGDGILICAAAFDNPRSLLDAAATLGAARIEAFLPMLVSRGNRPAGLGNRFILRVRQEDAEAAKALLSRAAQEEAADDEPRCPKCGSYRVTPVPRIWINLIDFVFGRRTPVLMECLRCRHRWTP